MHESFVWVVQNLPDIFGRRGKGVFSFLILMLMGYFLVQGALQICSRLLF